MKAFVHQLHRQHQGFTLVEVMVGMVIGMIGIIVMMQVFSVFEGQKRTTTGGSDAQTAGAVALYELERDIKQAGYGTSAFNLIGCNVTLLSGITLNSLAPVTINYANIPAGDANTDTLLVVYGGTNGHTEGDKITSVPGGNTYPVQTPSSFRQNDIVIALPQANMITPPTVRPACNLNMDTVQNVGTPNTADVTVTATLAGTLNGLLYNLGQAATIKINAYAVRGGNLTECNYMLSNCEDAAQVNNPAVWLPVASNIVSLKAVYGVDTTAAMDGIMDGFSKTLPGPAPPSQCTLIRGVALAVALVARNSQFNKEIVTNTAANAPAPVNAPTWQANNINQILGSANSPLGPGTGVDEPWKHYRYKVYETISPLRNINWQGAQTGC